MRCQVALELLFSLAILLVAVMLIYSSIVGQKNVIIDKTNQITQLKNTEIAGSAVSSEFNCFVRSKPDFSAEDIQFKIVDDKVIVRHQSHWLETEWVISNDAREPQ